MRISYTDLLVIAGYLAFVMVVGIRMKRRADQSKSEYLLGGKSISFWMLGVSNASGMFDISGTAWMVSIMFVYGVKSIWLPWLWPVFNQIFLMIYLSGWLRKSEASTGADWMVTRFGNDQYANPAHRIVVVFAILSCMSFMAYAFVGLGKFLEVFFPWPVVQEFVPFDVPPAYVRHFYGIIFTLFTVFYSLLGGMKSIVLTDVVHYVIVVIISVAVALMAMQALHDSNGLNVPEGWYDLLFGKNLNIDWQYYSKAIDQKITDDQFSPFGFFFALMAAKGILASMAGPPPNYDMQKILSTRSPREAALMSMTVNIVLLPARYLLITGVTVLAVLFHQKKSFESIGGDFEQLLPDALHMHIPAGLMGLTMVGFLGAFMASFAGTFNAAQAYLVNDIYLKSIRPLAGLREINRVKYAFGIITVVVSIVLGLFAGSLNNTLLWIVSALFGGYIAPNVLKFHWWRFNSRGYFCGMAAGILCALVCPYLFPGTLALYYFPLVFAVSLAGSLIGTFLSPPTEQEVLEKFYLSVRPWGFWKPVRKILEVNVGSTFLKSQFYRDAANIMVGIVGQTALTAAPVFFVLLMPTEAFSATAIFLLSAFFLWKTWYQRLG